MACVEAMACECPVVMTSLGSGPEIVADGANGLLVDPRDTDDLVSAVLELLGDSSLRHRLAFAARSLVCRKFNASNQLEVNLEFYQSVIRSAGSKWKSAA
jgi:glycosyltransferase involved in cell wall biosynthesis